jgi:Mlc titration factor MtfA (ptsG expression regulator)
MTPLAWIVATSLVAIALLLSPPLVARHRRARIRAKPLPGAWRRIIDRRVPLARRIPASLRPRFEGHVREFVDQKSFLGCAGMPIDDEVRVTVAAHAALLRLGRRTAGYDNLRDILLYPGAFAVERTVPDPNGLLSERRETLSGESWARGQVILSWQDVVDGAAIPDDGRNVAIHEFAHQVDQEKGHANGAPPGFSRERAARWASVFNAEYAELHARLARGEATLIHPYGATNPAEFFAVASEVFFEQAREMRWRHPALYAELSGFYGVDPARW